MNWNNNDTKYIIKRLVIYFLIAFAMFIFGTWKADARTIGTPISQTSYSHIMTQGEYIYNYRLKYNGSDYDAWSGVGEGNIIFSILANNVDQATSPIDQILGVYVYTTKGNQYVCDIGNNVSYIDNGTQRVLYTANCPVTLEQNEAWRYIKIQRSDNYGSLKVGFSTHATFVTKDGNVSVNVNQQEVVNAITNSQQSTINAITEGNNQAHQDAQQAHQDSQDIKDTITNDNITTSDADDFNNNEAFTDSTGLESVINLPLNMVNSLSNECQPIHIHIPYIESDATIPCMSTIYRSKFNSLYTLVKLVVNGFLVYRILLKVYELVHEAKQPDEDKLEVIEL